MATRSRRGSFGLQPRVAPNVTGQIVALAREYVAKRDSNIMSAWRAGGTFEGKKATDEMVLAYWKERGEGLDKDDPSYEESKNNVLQLEYAVAQSKADVLYVQGKLSETQYANFFLNWAKKVPKNSEFYRTLQKDAAQLIESAKSKGRANAERMKTEAFNSFVKTTNDRDIAIGEAMTQAVQALSKTTGLSITGNGPELLELLTKDVKANPNSYRYLLDTIEKSDPNWNGQLTEGYFNNRIKSAVRGYDLIADRAYSGGFVSAYASATQAMATMSGWGQNLKVWPVAESYTNIMNAQAKVMADPNASQMDKMAASAAASAELGKLMNTPGIDAGSKTMLEADAQRLMGQDAGDNPSFSTMIGRPGVSPEMAMQIGAWAYAAAEMKANPTAWAYAPVDANGNYDVTGRGALGMVPAGSVPPGAQGVMVPGSDGKAVLAMVSPRSVYTTNPLDPGASPQLAGYQIAYNVGGKSIQLWGYKDAKNETRWSLTSPLAEGSSTSVDSNGDVFVTPRTVVNNPVDTANTLKATLADGTQVDLSGIGQQLAGQIASGSQNPSISQNEIDPATGKVTGTLKVTYSNGEFVAVRSTNSYDDQNRLIGSTDTPMTIASNTASQLAFSQSRLAAGDVPGTTFTSPIQASVKAASYTQTQDQVSRFASDPAFQQAFLAQTMDTLGTKNPYDPRIASAWQQATTPQQERDYPSYAARVASERKDLVFPGGPVAAAYDKEIKVNFGGQDITIPGLPSYLKNQQATIGGGGSAASWNTASPWSSILPGLGMPQMPQGSPTLTTPGATPTATPTTTSGVTPLVQPTPSPTPTSVTQPDPYGWQGGGSGGGGGGGGGAKPQ